MMRWSVDAWDPGYGSSLDVDGAGDLADTNDPVDVDVEVAGAEWAPRHPAPNAVRPLTILFCDGTLRTDARIWITEPDGRVRPALAASVAAGAVRSTGGRASVVAPTVARALVSAGANTEPIPTRWGTYEPVAASSDLDAALVAAVLQAMGRLEVQVASAAAATAELVVVDGRLQAPGHPPGNVGYVKAHAARYLADRQHEVVAALRPGQRTPLFRLQQVRSTTLSWYLRLPGGARPPGAGIVRCEVSADLPPARAATLADSTCLALPRYASQSHKDSRAPQNLIPVGALERRLRHALGDPRLLERHLRRTAVAAEQVLRPAGSPP
ncbi:MAG: hypothetical protein WKF86_00625 [Acidimicrobiales bacterium]